MAALHNSYCGGVMPRKSYPVKRLPVTRTLDESIRYITLSRNQIAIVDAEDFERLSKWNWTAIWCPGTKTFYASRADHSRNKRIYIARGVFRYNGKKDVDHRDGNSLNNRKYNLRKATRSQNVCNYKTRTNNKSGY